MSDEEKVDGRINGPQDEPSTKDAMSMRLLFILMVALMLSVAQTVLWVVTGVQFILMALNKGEPNEQLAEFGTTLGVWMAKSVRFITAASEVKPWPWTELD